MSSKATGWIILRKKNFVGRLYLNCAHKRSFKIKCNVLNMTVYYLRFDEVHLCYVTIQRIDFG
jgi:hypothetical protein